MRMSWLSRERGWARGNNETKQTKIVLSQELEKWENKAVLVSV